MDKSAAVWSLITFVAGSALQVSGYQNPYLAGTLFLVALGLFVYALRDLEYFAQFYSFLPFGKISLFEGARLAYERLKGTLWSNAAERLSLPRNSPEGILDYMAVALSQDSPIYGRRPPSTQLERIDEREFKRGTITGGGKVLGQYGESSPAYLDLAIERRELRRAIKRMKAAKI